MTINEAKIILQAYRFEQDISELPEMAEAMKLLKDNRELQEWLEAERAFDEAFSSKIQDIEVPEHLEQLIVNEVVAKPGNVIEFPWWKQISVLGAVASMLLVFGLLFLPSKQAGPFTESSMTLRSFEEFADQSLKSGNGFNARAGEWGTLVKYLSEHDTPAPTVLPGKMDQMPPKGCMTLKYKDKPVGVICFGKNSKSHLFIINSEDFPQMPTADKPVLEQNPYTTSVYWSGNDRHYLLVSHDPQELSQFVSF